MGLFDFLGKIQNKKHMKSNDMIKTSVDISIFTPSVKEIETMRSSEAEEISKLDENCRKSEHGLTVSQILLLEYCKKGKYPNPEGGYQRFWWFDYGVKSVGAVLDQLEKNGFIRLAMPVEILSTLKVNELKNILSSLKLPVSGKKDDLVDRIKQNTDNETLRQFIRSEKYTLTELGEHELAANEYVSYLHSHKYSEVSVWDVNKNADLKHWRDYIWGIFNKCSMDYASNGQWGLYRNVRLSMAEFLDEEARFKDSFVMYGEVCFYDVNGMDIFVDYDDPSDLLLEGIITHMKKVAKESELTEEQMREVLSKRIEKCQPVKCRVQKEQMTDLILNKMRKL